MKQCTNCNFKTELNSDLFCAVCGARLKTVSENTLCKACGAELRPHARFCTKCGEMLAFGPTLSAVSERCSDVSLSVTAGNPVPVKRNPDSLVAIPTKRNTESPAPVPVPSKKNNADSLVLANTDPLVYPDHEWKYYFTSDEVPEDSSGETLTRSMIRAMGERAMKVIPERVAYYAPLVGVKYRRITIRNYKRKWGSCNRAGDLDFNCILMLTPQEVVDSVVVHELCHLLQMNHSDRFYAEVLRVFPDYWKWDAWLDNFSSILDRMEDGYTFRSTRQICA